jgi:hypothetical protein
MSDKPITKDELLEAHLAGGRQTERSYAVESKYYGRNPLDFYEFPSERLRREEARRVEKAKRRK